MGLSPRWKEALLLAVILPLPFLGWVSLDLTRDGAPVPGHLVYPLVCTAVFLLAHLVLRFLRPQADPLLLPLVAALTCVGLIMLLRLNPHMARLQLIWLGVGAALMLLMVALLRDYRSLKNYRYTLAVLGLA
ncbi:MAG: FtsW/RodA/SpoVE family cell cycle protein, partial [Actinomycetota bacterium]|nr:FtsW/RodA/SpoVE family cell cycle protein [Actinomycetota bacterium]